MTACEGFSLNLKPSHFLLFSNVYRIKYYQPLELIGHKAGRKINILIDHLETRSEKHLYFVYNRVFILKKTGSVRRKKAQLKPRSQ